jgi:hypothetical protein
MLVVTSILARTVLSLNMRVSLLESMRMINTGYGNGQVTHATSLVSSPMPANCAGVTLAAKEIL